MNRPRGVSSRHCGTCEAWGDHHTDRHLWTVDELAVHLRVSRMTIYRLIHAGTLAHTRVGRAFRVYQFQLDTYLRGSSSHDDA